MFTSSPVGEIMKKIIIVLGIIFLLNCSKKAEITHDTSMYSEPELKTPILQLKKGTVVDALEFRNHKWNVRDSIKIKYEGKVGYISPSKAVIDQDPSRSVFTWGHRSDYKPYYDPNDKSRYKSGAVSSFVEKLPKEKIPLENLLKDEKLEE